MNQISSATLYNSTLSAAMAAEVTYAQASTREATGLVSQTYGGLGGQSGQLLDLESEATRASGFATAATQTGDKVQSAYSAIGDIISDMESLEATLSSAVSGASTTSTTTLNSAATSALNSIVQALNSQYGSDYLFSGSATDTAPVDLSAYSAALSISDTSYYQGSDTVASVRVSSQETVGWGVTADNSAFEQAIRAAYGASTVSVSSTTSVEDAYSLAQSAVTALASLQAQVSQSATTLSNAASRQQTYLSLLTTSVSNIKDVDTAAVAAQVSEYDAQLTASYDALAKVVKINLSNYL